MNKYQLVISLIEDINNFSATYMTEYEEAKEEYTRFINAIEESELVVDIYDFNCTASHKNIEGQLNIAVWGMKY